MWVAWGGEPCLWCVCGQTKQMEEASKKTNWEEGPVTRCFSFFPFVLCAWLDKVFSLSPSLCPTLLYALLYMPVFPFRISAFRRPPPAAPTG